ncbi:MAG: hypothetical protein ACXVNO_10790, partial [Bacteroidia bacterium]
LYVLLGIIALFLALQLAINFYINKRLADNLQQQVKEATHGKYRLDLKNASVNFFNRSITLNKISFVPEKCDSCVMARYKIEANSVSLSGINIWHYLTTKSMSASSLDFDALSMAIYQAKHINVDDTAAPRLSLYKILSKDLKELVISQINVTDTRICVYEAGNDSLQVMFSDDSDIHIEKFLFNKKVDSTGRLFLADKLILTMKTFSYSLPNGLYTLKGKKMTASYSDSLLSVDSLELKSNFAKKDFNDAAGHQASWIKLKLSNILFERMNLNLFIEQNWFISKKLIIDKMLLETYRDKNAEFKHQVKPSVQEIIRKIPFLVNVDTIDVKSSDVITTIIAKGKNRVGQVSFNRMNGTITNVRNDTNVNIHKGEIRMKISGWFLNKGKFVVLYVFPLNTNKVVFDCSGRLVNMPLAEINNMIENSADISVKSGQLDTMSFSFHANDKESRGTMKFLYHDLNVDLLNKDDKKQNLKKKILSFVTNKFVIIDANPSKGEANRITQINYERYPYKTFFYYTQKSLESGILPAIGIKHADEMLKRTDDR